MSFLVLVGVSLLAFFYLRSTRLARQTWLAKIDLPGNWLSEGKDAVQLTLLGGADAGDFVQQDSNDQWRGQWRLKGHTLSLQGEGKSLSFDLHFFKPGNIGLEDSAGKRLVYAKVTNNVVSLDKAR